MDAADNSKLKKDSRRDPRVPISDEVTVVFDVDHIVGPGENISAQGVYFTTAAALRVHVQVAGSDRRVPGELVRLETMGNGRIGIAVRFSTAVELGDAPDAVD